MLAVLVQLDILSGNHPKQQSNTQNVVYGTVRVVVSWLVL